MFLYADPHQVLTLNIFSSFGFLTTWNIIKRKKYDLIWAKQSYPQAPLATLISKITKLPLYITSQNPNLLKEELVMRGTLLKPFQSLFASMLEPLIKWSYRNSSVVAAVSKYSASLAQDFGAKKIIIIPNGINVERFKNLKKKEKSKKEFVIVTTSSLIPRNGIDTLIDAVALLPRSESWKVVIAGDGPERERLRLLIEKHHLQNKVKLVGRIENRKIPELLSSADLFVRPSRHEGFGVSMLEAMAAGVPVIATPVGGIPDFIKQETTGLLVDPEKPEQLAESIGRLMQDNNLYKSLQKYALNLVTKKYNWENITDEVEKAFNSIT